MEINEHNYQVANEAIKNILYMYVDLIESYSGFGHGIETGDFDPYSYLSLIDTTINEPEGYTFGINANLLKTGSAIALLCMLSDSWDEFETCNSDWDILNDTKKAFIENRFKHMPDIHQAFELGFGESEDEFRKQLRIVYENHVVEYFKYLLGNC